MPGKRINDQQYRLYMKMRNLGYKQATAAAMAGMSERTARRLAHKNRLPSQREGRQWKTRLDVFESIWESEIVPHLQESPYITAIVLLEYLQDRYPGQYPNCHLRTLQRRLRQWRALCGHERDVIFRQVHPPGLQGLSDFTEPKDFQVTIQGKLFAHLLYHFRLAYSGWSYMKIIQGGESFTALAEGLQKALWRLGGSPQEHRTDSLSAAFKNLSAEDEKDMTRRYETFCSHYKMKATRNNRGCSHENGSIESPHGHLKRRLRDALVLRKSCDFESVEAYQRFIDTVVERHNRRHQKVIDVERQFLQALPVYQVCDFQEATARVTTSSTIVVHNVTYSVPSRLIGQRLRLHVYDDRLEGYIGSDHALTLPRVRTQDKIRKRCINYRHLIGSLSRKPQAFRYSVLRDDLLPTPVYKAIWRLLDEKCPVRQACKLMVGILKLAADYDCEEALGERVLTLLQKDEIPSLGTLQRRYEHLLQRQPVPSLSIVQHALSSYDTLLPSLRREDAHA